MSSASHLATNSCEHILKPLFKLYANPSFFEFLKVCIGRYLLYSIMISSSCLFKGPSIIKIISLGFKV